jgi:hypothetical protein
MSEDQLIKAVTKIEINSGEYLYIQLPEDISKETAEKARKVLQSFFKDKNVKILLGTVELKFSSANFV